MHNPMIFFPLFSVHIKNNIFEGVLFLSLLPFLKVADPRVPILYRTLSISFCNR